MRGSTGLIFILFGLYFWIAHAAGIVPDLHPLLSQGVIVVTVLGIAMLTVGALRRIIVFVTKP